MPACCSSVRACNIIEHGSGASWSGDKVIQKGGEVFPQLQATFRRGHGIALHQGILGGCPSIPLLAVVTLRDFVTLPICFPPKVGGGAAVPRPHTWDEGWSDQDGSTGDSVVGTLAIERDEGGVGIIG